jgi:hypothetical protein
MASIALVNLHLFSVKIVEKSIPDELLFLNRKFLKHNKLVKFKCKKGAVDK